MAKYKKFKGTKSGGAKRTRETRISASVREEQVFAPGEWEYYSSSRVLRARYDRTNFILEVDWVDGGLSYLYMGVEPNVWRNMNRVTSVGKFVNRVLNNYAYAPRVA